MKTIKLPIIIHQDISDLQRQSSIVIRYAYNRFCEGKSQKDIRLLCKSLNNIESLNSWLIQCAILKAKQLFDTKQEHIIFGGKYNYIQRCKNKITKEQYKQKRLLNIVSQGEKLYFGNRMFNFNIIEENKLVFKLNKKTHIDIQLPKLRSNIKRELFKLQELAQNKQATISIELNQNFIYITFEETLVHFKQEKQLQKNRIVGIDLNPNYIGLNVSEFDSDENQTILYSCMFDISKLTQKLGVSSDSKLQMHQENKRKFELYQICKRIQDVSLYWNCGKLSIEKLSFKTNDKQKGKNYNRLTNNKWNRNIIFENLKKRCKLNNIEYVEINPAYSSFIGNLIHRNYPDPIAASIEIARRGFYKYIKNKFYPTLIKIEDLYDLWKKTTNHTFNISYSNWKELYLIFKNLELKYRVPFKDVNPKKVFSLNNIKSCITLYEFV